MVNFALLGAGRIGRMHADLIAANPAATLRYVYDINATAAPSWQFTLDGYGNGIMEQV